MYNSSGCPKIMSSICRLSLGDLLVNVMQSNKLIDEGNELSEICCLKVV